VNGQTGGRRLDEKTILVALAATAPLSAVAFEVNGFRTEMNVSEAAAAAQDQGWTLTP
jgi:hypothetical protein